MTIGERIKTARKAARLSQRELGEKIGVTHAAVGQWESGVNLPSLAVRLQLAEVFGIKPAEFLPEVPTDAIMTRIAELVDRTPQSKRQALLAVIEKCIDLANKTPDDPPETAKLVRSA